MKLFNEKEFENDLLRKAKEKWWDITYELEMFKKYNQLEYLYILKQYIEKLNSENILTYLKGRGSSSLVAHIIGINQINSLKNDLSSKLFFKMQYGDNGVGPRFDICVPQNKKERAISILNELYGIDEQKSNDSIFFLKEKLDYRIGIHGSKLFERAIDVMHLNNNDHDVSKFFRDELSTFNVKDSIAFTNKGFFLSNLNGCIDGNFSDLYELIEIAKPNNLYELAIISCLNQCEFINREKMIHYLKKYGLYEVIYDEGQLLDILTDIYEIDLDIALELIEHAFLTHRLTERDELILDSQEVPSRIKEQIINIKYLYPMPAALEEMRLTYYLIKAKIKS